MTARPRERGGGDPPPGAAAPSPGTSCGVLATDGARLLIGHFTGGALWDIPKGRAEPGESFAAAAARELREETGLEVAVPALRPLGVHRYLPGKSLALFLWARAAAEMPDPAALRCRSVFRHRDGRWLPEFDAFAVLPWEEATARTGRNMRRVLAAVRGDPERPFGAMR